MRCIEILLAIGAFSVTMTFVLYEGGTVLTLAAEFFLRKREKIGEEKGIERERKKNS